MLGESPRTSAEHLLPQAVVVGPARLWPGREDGHRASIAHRTSASEILSDSEGGALAYRKLGKVFGRSSVNYVALFPPKPKDLGRPFRAPALAIRHQRRCLRNKPAYLSISMPWMVALSVTLVSWTMICPDEFAVAVNSRTTAL